MATSRRGFLKAVGAVAVTGMSGVSLARREDSAEANGHVLEQMDERIRKHRVGSAILTLVGADGQRLPAGMDLRIRQTRHKFLFGCNIFKLGRCRTEADNAAYAEQFAKLLNFATLPFYWWTYERQKGSPDYARTDEIVRWCRAHDVTTKGHPLAWNYVDPRWLTGTPEEIMQLQIERVGRCVERFKGAIDIWDVVNEATHYDRDQLKTNAPKLTEAVARVGIGEYVRTAFKAARQANPKATLLINDYRTDPAYSDKVISPLVDTSGKPMYDVIGIQSHMHGAYWGAARAWETCERFAGFGKPLHFTETTVVSGPRQGESWATTPEGEKRQAEQVAEFYTVLFSHPAVEAITWWDFSDQDAWQRAPAGLVRSDMTPKPAYEQLHRLIKGKWWTQTQAQVKADAKASVKGFLGDYEVEAAVGGRQLKGTFSLDTTVETPIEVRLA